MLLMTAEMAVRKRSPHHDYDPLLLSSKRLRNSSRTAAGGPSLTKKENKDNIGERVATLQQLVSPFGKSDTASVLIEATAYIKFLHDQLQVLSAPYLHSSSNGILQGGRESCSLRSRGLCLMPVAATVMIAGSNGADIWAPISK